MYIYIYIHIFTYVLLLGTCLGVHDIVSARGLSEKYGNPKCHLMDITTWHK